MLDKIKSVKSSSNGQRYYALHALAVLKNRSSKDFAKNFKDTLRLVVTNNNTACYMSSLLEGRFYLLKNSALIRYKQDYVSQYGYPYPRCSSIWVTDKIGAQSYLDFNQSEYKATKAPKEIDLLFEEQEREAAAHSFAALVEVEHPSLLEIFKETPQPVITPTTIQHVKTEEELNELLSRFSCLTNNPFRQEVVLLNTLDSKTKSRRLDLVRNFNDKLVVYELKLNPLTAEDVSQTLGLKGYWKLAKDQLNSKLPLRFYFIAPSINEDAARLLDMMPGIKFLSVKELVDQLIHDALVDVHPKIRYQQDNYRIQPLFHQIKDYF